MEQFSRQAAAGCRRRRFRARLDAQSRTDREAISRCCIGGRSFAPRRQRQQDDGACRRRKNRLRARSGARRSKAMTVRVSKAIVKTNDGSNFEIACDAILPFFGLTMKLGPGCRLGPEARWRSDRSRNRKLREFGEGHLRHRRHQHLSGQAEADPVRLPRRRIGGAEDPPLRLPGQEADLPVHDIIHQLCRRSSGWRELLTSVAGSRRSLSTPSTTAIAPGNDGQRVAAGGMVMAVRAAPLRTCCGGVRSSNPRNTGKAASAIAAWPSAVG